MTHNNAKNDQQKYIDDAVDMSAYSESIEWDIISVAAKLNKRQSNITYEEFYEGNKHIKIASSSFYQKTKFINQKRP